MVLLNFSEIKQMKNLKLISLLFFASLFTFCNEVETDTSNKTTEKQDTTKVPQKPDTSSKNTAIQKKHNIVDYFNLLQENKLIDVPCKLSKTDNKWKCLSEKDEAGFVNECGTTVDIKNGYIKIEDEGTGAGIYVTEVVLFKTSDQKDIIAVNNYFADDILQTGSNPPKFYSYKNKSFSVLNNIFPKTSPNDFFYKAYDLKKEQFGTYFELPHYGTDIKFCLDTLFASKREDTFRKNIKTAEFVFKFDKKQGRFLLK